VLYLFVIFILDLGSFRTKRIIHQQKPLAIAGGLALIVQLMVLTLVSTFPGPFGPPQEVVSGGNTQAVGGVLYTDFLFPFELASLVLLVAIFGAVVLARRESEETSS
jgi:NADH-quinone oxidoreductase subunit J